MSATADRLETLAQRRAALSAELAEHRGDLTLATERLQAPLDQVGRIRDNLRVARQRYAFLLLPVAVLALLNPRPTLRLLLGAWTLYRSIAPPPPPRRRLDRLP